MVKSFITATLEEFKCLPFKFSINFRPAINASYELPKPGPSFISLCRQFEAKIVELTSAAH